MAPRHQPREKEISSLYRILKQKQRELLFHGKYKEAAELTIDDLKAQGFQEKWRKIIINILLISLKAQIKNIMRLIEND